ncbi:hypothetical protein [Arthrobacter sp. Helios]|nr:hypothetical protein [Arthrobacter sp. Helios]UPO76825.1 hypothetical protein ArtHe_16080 [Arthrobacter sp. Helios]
MLRLSGVPPRYPDIPAEAVARAADRYDGVIDYAAPGNTFTVGAAAD